MVTATGVYVISFVYLVACGPKAHGSSGRLFYNLILPRPAWPVIVGLPNNHGRLYSIYGFINNRRAFVLYFIFLVALFNVGPPDKGGKGR